MSFSHCSKQVQSEEAKLKQTKKRTEEDGWFDKCTDEQKRGFVAAAAKKKKKQ